MPRRSVVVPPVSALILVCVFCFFSTLISLTRSLFISLLFFFNGIIFGFFHFLYRLPVFDCTFSFIIFTISILLSFNLLFFSGPHCMACGILVPLPGKEPVPSAVEAQSLKQWTTRGSP